MKADGNARAIIKVNKETFSAETSEEHPEGFVRVSRDNLHVEFWFSKRLTWELLGERYSIENEKVMIFKRKLGESDYYRNFYEETVVLMPKKSHSHFESVIPCH